MSDEKVLTKEIVEQFVDDPHSGDGFSQFTVIEDDAAEVLARFDEFALDLSGLTKLSDTAVGYISKCKAGLGGGEVSFMERLFWKCALFNGTVS